MKDIKLKLSGENIEISRGGNKIQDDIKVISKLTLKEIKSSDQGLNIVYVNSEIYNKYWDKSLILFNHKNGDFLSVKIVDGGKDLEEESFLCSKRTTRNLNIEKGDIVYFCLNKTFHYNKVTMQLLEEVKDDTIAISKDDVNGLFDGKLNGDYNFYEFFNTVTNQSIVVKRSHIKVENTKPGTIKMNMKQRFLLGVELPQFLTLKQVEILKNSNMEQEERELIEELYPNDNYFLVKDCTYNQQIKANKIIKKYTNYQIAISPVTESFKMRKRRSFLKALADFYVGKSTISLACKRPYITDEMANVVRITSSNMNLLGLKEMDDAIISYKNKKIRCRVLELKDKDNFNATNTPINYELAIGVPAQVREQLGIKDVSSVVKVDRDTISLFKKNINSQIIPVFLTIFSTKIFTMNLSNWISLLFSVLAIPIVVYFNLSSKRHQRIK